MSPWPPISTRSAFRSMSASAAGAGRCGAPISSRSPPAASTATAAGPRSRRRYDAGLGVRTLDALHAVIAFFEERRGRLYRLPLPRPHRLALRPALAEPTPLDQRIGTGDGASRELPARRRPTAPSFAPYSRTIAKPVGGTVRVAVERRRAGGGLGVHLRSRDRPRHLRGRAARAAPPSRRASPSTCRCASTRTSSTSTSPPSRPARSRRSR